MGEEATRSCYFDPFIKAGVHSEVELSQLPDALSPQILTIGEMGIITSSYIESTSFPTNQGRSINDNASSFSNHSPTVKLDASILRTPMIGELRNIHLSDIKNSTSSTTRERNTDNDTFHNDLIQSHVKGLPDGWVCKIRNTGSNSKFKVYIDPKSEYEFRSMLDAQRYIVNKDISHCVVKPKKRKSFEQQTEGRELDSQSGDWLPPGWVMNIRTQHGGKCHGVKKKSYYNPSTGLRFYSKVKLFQHHESQTVLIPAVRETSSVKTSHSNNSSSPTNHQQSQINNTFKVLTGVSSNSLPNTGRMEITNLQKGAPEFQVPSSIRFGKEDCGPSGCHFSDNSPDLESVHSSSLPSQGIAVDNSSCATSYLNCLVGENSEEMRLVDELSPACLAGDSSIQATDSGQEWPLNDTVNAPQKIIQQFSEFFNDECLFENPVQMPEVHITAPEMAHSQSLRRQDEDVSVFYGNFEMSQVSQPIMRTHEQGSTTSMIIETIKKLHQAHKDAAALSFYQMMHPGNEAEAKAFCEFCQPAQSNLGIGSFYRQEGPPYAQQVSTEPTAEQEKGDAILDQPAQSNLFTGSFYRQDDVPCVEPALTGELQRNTPSHQEFSSEQAQLGTSDSEKPKTPHAFAIGNSGSDPYDEFDSNVFTRDASQFDDTDKVAQYFEQLEEQNHK